MEESARDRAKRFAEQQYELFGEIIRTGKGSKQEPKEEMSERSLEAGSGEIDASWFAEQIGAIDEKWTEATSLDSLSQLIADCKKCPLWETRSKLVFGTGNPEADIVVIGEAPGAEEDKKGEPFVGAAGKLLTKILAAINLERDDVYICNIVKSRPPGNRTPEQSEVDACIPYLYKQLDLIRPRFVLALGLTAAKSLLNTSKPMKVLRGTVHDWHGISVIVTYHPAALLRNPEWKRATWEDVQLLRRLYDDWHSGK